MKTKHLLLITALSISLLVPALAGAQQGIRPQFGGTGVVNPATIRAVSGGGVWA